MDAADKNSRNTQMRKAQMQKFLFFFENYSFPSGVKIHWSYTPILIILIFLTMGKDIFLWMVLHLGLCILVSSWLGTISIRKRFNITLLHFQKYLPLANSQEQLIKAKSLKQLFSLNVWVFFKYAFYSNYSPWTSGEILISLGFFILCMIPVFLPIVIFFDVLRSNRYFIYYSLLLFLITLSFFWFGGYLYWKKKLKKQIEKDFMGKI